MEQYIFTLDNPNRQEYLEYYVEKCQDLMTSLFSDPRPTKTLEFIEKNLRVVQSAMEKSSCMRLVRAVVGLLYQYSEIFGDLPHLTTFDELFKYHGYKVSHNHLLQGIRDMIKDLGEISICSNSPFGRDVFHFYLSRLFAYADYLEINIETRTNVLYGIYVTAVDTNILRASPEGDIRTAASPEGDIDEASTKKVQAIVWTGDKLSIHPFPTSHSVEYLNQFAIMNKGKIAALCKTLYEKLEDMGPDGMHAGCSADTFEDLVGLFRATLRAVEADKLLLEVAIALRGHENIRFSSLN